MDCTTMSPMVVSWLFIKCSYAETCRSTYREVRNAARRQARLGALIDCEGHRCADVRAPQLRELVQGAREQVRSVIRATVR